MGLLVSHCSSPCDCVACTPQPIGYTESGAPNTILTATYAPSNPISPPVNCPVQVQLYGSNIPAYPTLDVYLVDNSGLGTWDYEVTYDGATIYSETGTFNSATQLFRLIFKNSGWFYGPDWESQDFWLWNYSGSASPNSLPQIVASVTCSLPLSGVTWNQVVIYSA